MRLVIRANRQGVLALGPYRVRSSPSLRSAIRAFGDPSAVGRRWGRSGCRVSWPLIGLVIQFANFGGYEACSPAYGRAQSVFIRGSNGRLWRTARGLRIGQSVGRLRRRHPSAEPHRPRLWWLVTGQTFIGPSCGGGPCPYAVLSASVRAGKVSAFQLWVALREIDDTGGAAPRGRFQRVLEVPSLHEKSHGSAMEFSTLELAYGAERRVADDLSALAISQPKPATP
jgi:hypothetical protein